MELLVHNLLNLAIAAFGISNSGLSDTATIIGNCGSQIPEAGRFFQLLTVHGDVCTDFLHFDFTAYATHLKLAIGLTPIGIEL